LVCFAPSTIGRVVAFDPFGPLFELLMVAPVREFR
jgi:hypothetical protein